MSCVCVHTYVCKCLVFWIYPDIWANFSQNHTCYFLRGGQQLKTYTEGLLKTSTCSPEPPHRGVQAREEKQSSFKSQALISVNHILCKTSPLVCSWNSSKYQSGSFWPYKEKKGGIRDGLAKVGPTQTFLAYYQYTAFCALPPPSPLHISPNSACVSHFPLE